MRKILLPLLAICLTSCLYKEGDKTPLGWCLWEIQKHEGFERCGYTYQNIYAEDFQKEASQGNKISAYIVTTYVYPMRTEWCCFIEYRNTWKEFLNEDDVVSIDCDVIWEENYE